MRPFCMHSAQSGDIMITGRSLFLEECRMFITPFAPFYRGATKLCSAAKEMVVVLTEVTSYQCKLGKACRAMSCRGEVVVHAQIFRQLKPNLEEASKD